MASAQIMTSTSIFSSPFHDPSNDPEAIGSYTCCEGPPAKSHTSPVCKFRKHIASTFAAKTPKISTGFLESQPFDSNILILPFVPEAKPSRARTCPEAPPAVRIAFKPATMSNTLEPFAPFDNDIIEIPFIIEDGCKQPKPSRKLRRLPSRITIADIARSPSTTDLLDDDIGISTETSISSRQMTAAGDGGYPPSGAGQAGPKGCPCPCGCPQCHFANMRHCKCACPCKNCYCKSRNLSNKVLMILERHGLARRRSNDSNLGSEEDDCDNGNNII